MAPRLIPHVETVAALLEEQRRLMEIRHAENKETLRDLREAIKDLGDTAHESLKEAKKTNGRVNELEVRMVKAEARHIAASVIVPVAAPERDWKLVGSGVGALFFVIWGALSVLKVLFDFLGKVGGAMVGKP